MTTLKLKVVIRVEASSVITFGDVNLFFAAVVVRNFNVDLCISVAAVGISVAINNRSSVYFDKLVLYLGKTGEQGLLTDLF